MQNNNIAGTQIAGLNFGVWPPTVPPQTDYTKVEFPDLGAIYFSPKSKDYGFQSFILYDALDSSGVYAQFGTFSNPMKNWGYICDTSANENFQVYDSTGKMLFAVTGTGIAKLNKISRLGAVPVASTYAALGSTGTAVVTAGGTDTAFEVVVTAAGSGLASGNLFHVAFATPFLVAPIIVAYQVGADNATLWPSVACVNNVTVNGFDMFYASAPSNAPGSHQRINFLVIG